MRLDSYLVHCGLGSKKDVKLAIKKGVVSVNQEVIKKIDYPVQVETDRVQFDGENVIYEAHYYYLFHKPKGVISATEDDQHRTVLDLLDETARHKQVFPLGRLDIDTTGLLLLTNNGPLAHAMLSPKKHVSKVYQAKVAGLMTTEDVTAFAQGIELKDFVCQPATLRILESDQTEQTCQVEIEIAEGKFHQVKRMVASRGKKVLELKRLSMGPLTLPDDLEEGQYRRLTERELADLSGFQVDL